ncbi:uncharacterized protein LOC127704427 isoform X1 [Mytilus californianus]|uniref:uncharacterized protein LOC127704427 isoform X1 n=1 Tax=Mytilus californianus TaxID=6549 RepID=UPI0022463944|nr:uncharacterized protein LOC127704427 isoform X1 [Mytilus californianus]
MTDKKLCSGCLRDDEKIEAEAWCNECLEEVCKTCAKVHRKLNPPHKVIPLHQVSNLSSSILKISKDCDVHTDQRTVLFCTQHDKVICDLCLSDTHKNCESIISIDRAAKGVKSGTALADLKSRIEHLNEMLPKLLKCQTKDEKEFDRQRDKFLQQISSTRQQINNHLDQIEKETIEELNKQYKTTKHTMDEAKHKTQKGLEAVATWINELSSIETISNEVLLFQTIKVMDNKTHIEETNICELNKQHKIEFDPFDTNDLPMLLRSMGDISLTENQMHIPALQYNLQQIQEPVKSMEEEEGKIQRSNSFLTSVLGSYVKIENGCFVSGKRLLLSRYNTSHIYACGYDGNDVQRIHLIHNPWRVAMIDDKRAIVTLQSKGFQILDLTTLTLGRCIKPGKGCYAVTCSNGQIWTSDDGTTINQIDTSGNILRSITTKNEIRDFCIDNDSNIYYTPAVYDGNNVYRITPDGQESIFCSHSDLIYSLGIDVDHKGNVYVGGASSDNIHRISSDGKDHQIILAKNDGIKVPWGLCYNRDTKQLLVANDNKTSVAIYNLP